MNLCIDCKHATRPWFGKEFSKCRVSGVDGVTGKPRWFCSTLRRFDYPRECPKFEQRRTIWMAVSETVTSLCK